MSLCGCCCNYVVFSRSMSDCSWNQMLSVGRPTGSCVLTSMPAGRLWGSTSSAVSLIIITGCPPYAVVYRRRSCSFSGRCCTYLERSAAARHVCTLAACFSQSSEDAPLQTLLSVTPSSDFVVPVKWLVIIGHVNRSFFLLTYYCHYTSLLTCYYYYYYYYFYYHNYYYYHHHHHHHHHHHQYYYYSYYCW